MFCESTGWRWDTSRLTFTTAGFATLLHAIDRSTTSRGKSSRRRDRCRRIQPAIFLRLRRSRAKWRQPLSQVFMGIRIECAQCHHHPFDQWSQRDYYGMEAFFTQVNFKSTPAGQVLIPNKNGRTKHPRTGDRRAGSCIAAGRA